MELFDQLTQRPLYSKLYTVALRLLAAEKFKMPYFKASSLSGLVTAIWPLLYIKDNWCESATEGGQSRVSAKKMFYVKVISGVLDFGQVSIYYVTISYCYPY